MLHLNRLADTSDDGSARVYWAILLQNIDDVRILTQAGANVHAVNADGMSTLHYASVCGWYDLSLNPLIKQFTVNPLDNDDASEPDKDTHSCYEHIMSLLIAAGANVNPEYKFKNKHREFIQLLKDVLNTVYPLNSKEYSTISENELRVINTLHTIAQTQSIPVEMYLTPSEQEKFYNANPLKSGLLRTLLTALDLHDSSPELSDSLSYPVLIASSRAASSINDDLIEIGSPNIPMGYR